MALETWDVESCSDPASTTRIFRYSANSRCRRLKVHGSNCVAEFYNAFNTPQFATTTTVQGATQITVVGTANFGHVTSTSVAPRLIQFGLKYLF